MIAQHIITALLALSLLIGNSGGTIGGTVYQSPQTINSTGVSGWPVSLVDSNNNITTKHTDSNGEFSFTELAYGQYELVVSGKKVSVEIGESIATVQYDFVIDITKLYLPSVSTPN